MKSNHSRSISQAFRVILLIACCCVLTATSVAMNQYYVNASSGNDSNDGSQAHPWATINHANAALVVGAAGACVATDGWYSAPNVGACVHVASGTYSGAISTTRSGTSSARIFYVSDTKYGAVLIGSSNQLLWTVTGAYTGIVGFDFDGTTNGNNMQTAIGSYYSGDHTSMLYNKIHNFSKNGGHRNGASAIGSCIVISSAPTSPCANTIENNLVYHNNGGAGTGQTSYGDSEDGISVGYGDIVRNNIVIDQGGGWCVSASHTTNQATITNNLIANCDRAGILIANAFTTNDYTTVTNNIIVNSGGAAGNGGINVFGSGGCGSHNLYANNLMYGNTPGNVVSNTCTINLIGTQSGSNATTFVNYTGTISGDYHLKSGSPAIAAGTATCAGGSGGCVPSIDFDGDPRSLASNLDVGAYVFGTTSASLPAAPTGLTAIVQ